VPTLFTTNLPPRSKDRDVPSLADRLGQRVTSRLGEMARSVPLTGTDRRPGCNCRELGDAIEARSAELIDDPDIGDAQLCEDCRVLVPFLNDCYMIDCGNVVCLPCGEKRGFTRSETLLADI
jgi:hypothetical protein